MYKSPLEEFLDLTELQTNPDYVSNLLKTAYSKNITIQDWNTFIDQFQALISRDAATYLGFKNVLKEIRLYQPGSNFVNAVGIPYVEDTFCIDSDKLKADTLYDSVEYLHEHKVDRLAPIASGRSVYTVTADGEIELIRSSHTVVPYTYITRTSAGQADIADPTDDDHITNKRYVDEGLAGKVDKIDNFSTVTGVYAVDGSNEHKLINVTNKNYVRTIVWRDVNGHAMINDPTEYLHIANKKYVDEQIATFDFIKVVDTLPETGLPNKIYLVPKSDTQNQDLFDEWVWINKGTEEEPNFDWEWVTTKQLEVDLTPYVKKDEVDEFLALPLETGEGENSLVINEGNANGDNSIAGGTTDINLIKSVLGSGYVSLIEKYGNIANMSDTVLNLILNAADVGYTLDEFKRLLTISPATAEGLLAISLGASNKSKSTAGISLGYGNISGGKGYYITAINTSNKTITLSTRQDTASAPAKSVDWAEGDRLFITNDDRYWCEVSSVSGNVVTLKELPFTSLAELKKVTIPLDATYNITNPTERSVINIDKPESGEVDIGWGAIGIGALNTILGSNAFGVGYKNLIAGDFGASFGQENQVGYSAGAIGILINALAKATFGAGCGHTLTEKYQSAVGKWSKENKEALFRVGNGSSGNPSNAMEVLKDGTIIADKFKGGLDYTLDEKKYQYRPIFFSGYKAGTATPDGTPHLNSGFEYNEGENTLRVGKINLTNISKGTADVFRNVWFSDNTTDGKVNHNSDFQYNPATGVLKVGGGLKVGNTEITEEQLGILSKQYTVTIWVDNVLGTALVKNNETGEIYEQGGSDEFSFTIHNFNTISIWCDSYEDLTIYKGGSEIGKAPLNGDNAFVLQVLSDIQLRIAHS